MDDSLSQFNQLNQIPGNLDSEKKISKNEESFIKLIIDHIFNVFWRYYEKNYPDTNDFYRGYNDKSKSYVIVLNDFLMKLQFDFIDFVREKIRKQQNDLSLSNEKLNFLSDELALPMYRKFLSMREEFDKDMELFSRGGANNKSPTLHRESLPDWKISAKQAELENDCKKEFQKTMEAIFLENK